MLRKTYLGQKKSLKANKGQKGQKRPIKGQKLKNVQNHFEIKKYEIKKEQKEICIDVVIATQRFYKKEDEDLLNIPNPFKKRHKVNKKTKNIHIDAIITNEVLIEGEWYKKGDTIKRFVISKISTFEVIFKDKHTQKYIIKAITNE